jgi:hypothetical protein
MAYKDVVIVAAVVRCVCTDHSLLVVMAVSWDSCYVFRVFHKITFWIFLLFFSFCSRRSWFAGARTPVCFVFWGEEGSACLFESWKMCNSHVPTCLFWLDDFVGLVGRTWTLVCRLTYRLLLSTWRDLTFARSIIYPLSDRKSRSFSRFSLSRMLRLAAHCTQGALAGRGFIQYENAFRPCMYTFTLCYTQVSILCLIFPSPPVFRVWSPSYSIDLLAHYSEQP